MFVDFFLKNDIILTRSPSKNQQKKSHVHGEKPNGHFINNSFSMRTN